MLRHEKEDGKEVRFSVIGSYKESVYVIPDEDREKVEVEIRGSIGDHKRLKLALDAAGINIAFREGIIRYSDKWQRWEPLDNYDCELVKQELTNLVTEVIVRVEKGWRHPDLKVAFNMGYVDFMVALNSVAKENELND